jgi:hypothetical protein
MVLYYFNSAMFRLGFGFVVLWVLEGNLRFKSWKKPMMRICCAGCAEVEVKV